MPLGSMIMITAPSPRMVLPENISMCRSLVDIGLTTISSVWNTPSTTMPKVWLPTWVTTMKPFSGSEEEPSSILSSFFRCISGSSLLRNRNTAVSLIRSMRCSELARARTSSTTANCGIAKRSPAASTISAETMASVRGILMVTLEPAAIVGDADDDVAAFMIGRQANGALLGLAGGSALGRRLQAVIGRVAHHMGQGILDQVEHLAVELGVGAVHLQFDLLVKFAGQIAHDSRQLLPGIADRLHPRLHDAFLQFGGDVRQPLQRHLEFGILVAPRDLQELIAGQNQFRHHRHQMFQRIHIDADRLVGDFIGLLHFDLNDRFAGRRFL